MWVRHEFPDAREISLLDEGLFQRFLGNPSRFRQELLALPEGVWVFVDEIQRLPNLLNEVHYFIEDRQLKFVLTGSSARKLKRADVNLLSGRALQRHLHPFLPVELTDAWNTERALRYGTLPLVWDAPEPEETLRAYVQMYLKEEIRAEALVRNLPGFARFLPVAGLFHGQVVNVANIARDAEAGRTTVAGYLEILEDTLLAFRVPAFEPGLRVRERRHPKLYWCDAGLARAVAGQRGEVSERERGVLFEGLVATVLRAHRDYHDAFDDIAWWAPSTAIHTEVDFVLTRERRHVALEVKATCRIGPEHCRGLRALQGLPGLHRRIIVYLGDRPLRTEDGIEVMSLPALSALLAGGKLWQAG
jgi:predicted AAA+ superfamily ATPase